MAQIVAEGLTFDFPTDLGLLKFDQQDKNKPDFHVLHAEMKAVDVIAELPTKDVYVEIKDFMNKKTGVPVQPSLEHLLESLKYKYRDSFVYRYGQGKTTKPVLFVCLIDNLDKRLFMQLQKRLAKSIPAGKVNGWVVEILHEVIVVDKSDWNRNLSVFGTVV